MKWRASDIKPHHRAHPNGITEDPEDDSQAHGGANHDLVLRQRAQRLQLGGSGGGGLRGVLDLGREEFVDQERGHGEAHNGGDARRLQPGPRHRLTIDFRCE